MWPALRASPPLASCVLLALLLVSSGCTQVDAGSGSSPDTQTEGRSVLPAREADSSLVGAFEWAWDLVQRHLYDKDRTERFFTATAHARLLQEISGAESLDEVRALLNRFLDQLDISHTGFYTDSDVEYALFKSMFVWRRLEVPTTRHIGIQSRLDEDRAVVQAVWEGSPAERAGLRRGDVILGANGRPYRGLASFRDGPSVELQIARNDSVFGLRVEPVEESVHLAMFEAMKKSARILDVAGHRIGYVHLWTGTSPTILQEFRSIIEYRFAGVTGIVLDLRDGFGGAWHDYLDPFFADRSGYFSWSVRNRDGEEKHDEPEASETHPFFSGPLVVLINEGTRSGKEALAYQFKKSKRALLVGTTTAGYFTGGRIFFPEQEGYALYVAVHAVELDGQQIEGIGIAPDVEVEYPLEPALETDPQLERALLEMRVLLEQGQQ